MLIAEPTSSSLPCKCRLVALSEANCLRVIGPLYNTSGLRRRRTDVAEWPIADIDARHGTGTFWPDVIVSAVMAALVILGGWTVIRQSIAELNGVTVEASQG